MLVVHGDKVGGLGGGQVGDSGGRSARDDERGVDLVVLHGIGGISEGLIHRVDVVEGRRTPSKRRRR